MTTRDLIYQAIAYQDKLTDFEKLSERQQKKLEKLRPVITPEIQAGLAIIQHKDRRVALQYAMDMEQLAAEKPVATPSIWNRVTDILAEATEV